MQINNVKCTATPQEWAKQLEKAYPYNAKHKSRYVYMNQEGRLKAFIGDDIAIGMEYKHKLTAEKMIELTETFFNQPKEAEKIYSARELYVFKHAFDQITIEVSKAKGWFGSSSTINKAKKLALLSRTGIGIRISNERKELQNQYVQKYNELQKKIKTCFGRNIPPFLPSFLTKWKETFKNEAEDTQSAWESYTNELNSQINLIDQRSNTIDLIQKVSENLKNWNKWFQRKEETIATMCTSFDLDDINDSNNKIEMVEVDKEKTLYRNPNEELQVIIKELFSTIVFHDDKLYKKTLKNILNYTTLESFEKEFNLRSEEMSIILTETIIKKQPSIDETINNVSMSFADWKKRVNESKLERSEMSISRADYSIDNQSKPYSFNIINN